MNNDQTTDTATPVVDSNDICPKCGKNPCECADQPVVQTDPNAVPPTEVPTNAANQTVPGTPEKTEEASAA